MRTTNVTGPKNKKKKPNKSRASQTNTGGGGGKKIMKFKGAFAKGGGGRFSSIPFRRHGFVLKILFGHRSKKRGC